MAFFSTSPRNAILRRQHHQISSHPISSSSYIFYDARFGEPQLHFLESCSLCKRRLANKDIFMYRGDIPFCSEECRQEQIAMDEAKEKNMNLSSSVEALRKTEYRRSNSPTKGQDYSHCPGTINAAA